VILQLLQVRFPQYYYDLEELGSPSLEESEEACKRILDVHASLSLPLCGLVLATAVWQLPNRLVLCGRAFVAAKLAHVAASLVAAARFPAHAGWLAVYPVNMLFLNSWIGLQPFFETGLVAVATFAAFIALLTVVHGIPPDAAATTAVVLAASLAVCRAANHARRALWRAQALCGAELRRLREQLYDLLPWELARRVLRDEVPAGEGSADTSAASGGRGAGAPRPYEDCRAVVLQLDLCGFTALSQTLTPLEVAEMVHRYNSR
jgi:hypothetical protein